MDSQRASRKYSYEFHYDNHPHHHPVHHHSKTGLVELCSSSVTEVAETFAGFGVQPAYMTHGGVEGGESEPEPFIDLVCGPPAA